jgi:hypothetical protein
LREDIHIVNEEGRCWLGDQRGKFVAVFLAVIVSNVLLVVCAKEMLE